MPEKERARLKEQYIKELRERKQAQDSINTLRKRQGINQALNNMVETLENTTSDSADDIMHNLEAETALNEARLDIALENQESHSTETSCNSLDINTPPAISKTIGPRLRSDDVTDDS